MFTSYKKKIKKKKTFDLTNPFFFFFLDRQDRGHEED